MTGHSQTIAATDRPRPGPGVQVFVVAGFLASAGVPLYIHLPRFAAELGLSLGAIGGLLAALRLVDFVQDPALGWMADRYPGARRALAALAFAGMGLGYGWVFVLQPGMVGLALGLVLIFTAFSLATLLFYGQGVALVGKGDAAAHYRLGGLREAGALAGIVLAALLPSLLSLQTGAAAAYAAYGAGLAVVAALAWYLSRPLWALPPPPPAPRPSLRPLFAAGGGYLLLIALMNAVPVAITSTLFLFFVEDRLQLPNLAGLYLVAFFAAAGLAAPVWARLAARVGARAALLPAMGLAVACFVWAGLLPAGAAWQFALICLGSGLALGADMAILPALFASTLARAGLPTGLAFGAWSFAGKASLAIAAAVALPLLHRAGFVPGGDNDAQALAALNFAYAVLPCALKLPAMILVARLTEPEPGEIHV